MSQASQQDFADKKPYSKRAIGVHLPDQPLKTPNWMRQWLWAAALYNVLFGAWVVLLPNTYFEWLGITVPNYPQLWQCIGMIVGVYGLGYFVAGFSPLQHWPIVLVGFLGKIFGPLGFLQSLLLGTLPWSFGWILLTNDLIWWVPFYLILAKTWQHYTQDNPQAVLPDLAVVLSAAVTNTGETLAALSKRQPVLVVCLRHFGCTFCREMVDDVLATMPAFSLDVVFVTTGQVHDAQAFFEAKRQTQSDYPVNRIHWVSDPLRMLYQVLGLKRGRFSAMFGWDVWARGLKATLAKGYGVGILQGDGFQQAGAFVLMNEQVKARWMASKASDRLTNDRIITLIETASAT
jgi:hypothetical protein